MSDIVERLRSAITLKTDELEAADEIESLRQLVDLWKTTAENQKTALTDLRQRVQDQHTLIEEIGEELATLKESQGEPVAQICSWGCQLIGKTAEDFEKDKISLLGTPLYTSAQTIPEGWQIVPVEPTDGMIVAAWNEDQYKDQDAEWADIYRAMLAAAPAGHRPADYKHEDVK